MRVHLPVPSFDAELDEASPFAVQLLLPIQLVKVPDHRTAQHFGLTLGLDAGPRFLSVHRAPSVVGVLEVGVRWWCMVADDVIVHQIF